MASLNRLPKGRWQIQVMVPVDGGKVRRSIRPGKMSKRTAEGIKAHVEHLVAAKASGQPLNPATADWLAEIDADLYGRLARVGLVEPSVPEEPPVRARLGQFLDDYVQRRTDAEGSTKEVWGHTIRNLKEFFGEERDLESITEGEAEDFKTFLIGKKLATTTVSKRLSFARQFIDMARKRRLILSNPFCDVKLTAPTTTERQRFIDRPTIDRILAACNPTWRLIVALARYGGLRCPSEVLMLRWEGVNWATGRITVDSPKGKRHGKGTRVIPLFPELSAELESAWERAPEGAVYVVNADQYRAAAQSSSGWRNSNLRTQFERILKRAGVESWPRLFHNLRASRETELAADHPIHVVTGWLGNTPKIAMKHYLQITDADFQRATGDNTKSGAKSGASLSAGVVQKEVQPLQDNISHNGHALTQTHIRQLLRHLLSDSDGLCLPPKSGEEGIRTPGGPYQPSPV